MPLRPSIKRQVLKHQDRIPSRNLGQDRLKAGFQRINKQVMSPCSSDHFYL